MLFYKRIDEITPEVLKNLVENEVKESERLEYKSEFPEKKKRQKQQLLKEVSAFANTLGGDLLYGIDEEKSVASEIVGVELDNPDEKKRGLLDQIQSCLTPPIPNLKVEFIELEENKYVVLIRVPQSHRGPHQIIDGKSIYGRQATQSKKLALDELRDLFIGREEKEKRLQDYRLSRVLRISEDDGPVRLSEGHIIVFHIIPFSSLKQDMTIDFAQFEELRRHNRKLLDACFFPEDVSGNGVFNFDGYLHSENNQRDGKREDYFQVFRNGTLESVSVIKLKDPTTGSYPLIGFENHSCKCLTSFFELLRELRVEPPYFVCLSLLKTHGLRLRTGDNAILTHMLEPILKDQLLFQPVLAEDMEWNPKEKMKPVFDALWNAVGYPRSKSYNADGKWKR